MRFFFHLENWFDVNYPTRWSPSSISTMKRQKKIVPARAHLDDTFVYIFTFHFASSSFCFMWTTYDERSEGGGCWAIMRTTQRHRAEDVEQINKFYCFRGVSLVDFSSLSCLVHDTYLFLFREFCICCAHLTSHSTALRTFTYAVMLFFARVQMRYVFLPKTYTQACAQLREIFMIF